MTMDAMPRALLERVAKARVLGKSPVGAYLRVNDWIWRHLPGSIAALRPVDSYGRFLHSLACLHADREMYLGTFFLRNRAELELIRRLSEPIAARRPVKIAVLGCSNGAEVYSIRWALRSIEPNVPRPAAPGYRDFMERFEAAYRAELQAFLEAVRDNLPSPCGGEEARRALRLALTAERSRAEHRPVAVWEVG